MYRLYNKYTGEHFYTGSESERDGLVAAGWTRGRWLDGPGDVGRAGVPPLQPLRVDVH